ncbi:MAG: arylsulfatase [Verrucomicrobiales bacterium]|nr:arylsulfatase [Verrucomicrobiales bacterium]|tara:strand:- start:256 stop:1707 length:1452 start_codon:yes stop_codon:yes gene_type:complete
MITLMSDTMRHALPLLIAILVPFSMSAVGGRKPNVLLIYTDDHGQWAAGAYGNKDVHTPTMDRLAQEGMRFTRGFTKPVCSPSRAMVLTGLYTHRVGIPDFIAFGNPVKEDVGLPSGTPTIASMLKAAGYETALVGKWHLGYGPKYYPTKFGFDHAEGFRYIASDADPAGVGRIPFLVDGKVVPRFRTATNHTDVLADRAIDFIEQKRDKPFFLFLSIYLPHLPWGAITDGDKSHYEGRQLQLPETGAIDEEELLKLTRLYYANITCADRNMGRVLKRLHELNLRDDTIVIFIGDNGFMVGQHDLLGKGNARFIHRGERGKLRRPNMFDDSVLVPFIVRWPGVVKPGTTSDSLVSTLDVLPTIADAIKLPVFKRPRTDGRSLVPLLRGKASGWRDAWFDTYEMVHLGNNGEVPYMRMIRTQDWKLILYNNPDGSPLDSGTRHELFNLRNDPGELTNLFDSPASRAERDKLRIRLNAWMKRQDL